VDDESNTSWKSFRDTHEDVANTVLGTRHHSESGRISDCTRELICRKHDASLRGPHCMERTFEAVQSIDVKTFFVVTFLTFFSFPYVFKIKNVENLLCMLANSEI